MNRQTLTLPASVHAQRERRYVGMRCRRDCGSSDCQCKFDRAWEERQRRLSQRANVFCFCVYWGTWSRVLTPYRQYPVIELNLTPVNPTWNQTWEERVRPIIFRSHGTSLDPKDELAEQLPEAWRIRMTEMLGADLTDRLLTTDWLPLLDMARVRQGKYGGGGLPFDECKRKEGG